MTLDEVYINRCLQIANNGLGSVRPNPMVGAVIVKDNQIIGEGFTSAFGGPHAEVNAINSVKNKTDLESATLFVTLEPCSHYGKTPPCSDLIIRHKIPRVVIGCLDDNPKVAGKGVKKLKSSGCDVKVGILEDLCKKHHKRFFTFINKKRPYIILKWAQSQDGFIAPITKNEQKPVWISNPYSRQIAHKWRAEEQAILVGTNTVFEDNPSLTVRDWTGQNPQRFVLGKSDFDRGEFHILTQSTSTVLLNEDEINYDNSVAKEVCHNLYKRNINSIIIEGGAQTLQTFIDDGLWDEARVLIGNSKFKNGVKVPIFNGRLISETKILEDILLIYEQN